MHDRNMLIFICISFVIVVCFVILCYFIEMRRANKFKKDVSEVCEKHVGKSDDEMTSILLFREELKKEIRTCEDTADQLRSILKDVDNQILNPKYYGINNENEH